MRIILFFLFCSMKLITAFAQKGGSISITIQNQQQAPVENATVELRKAKDSLLVKLALTDKNGQAEFLSIPSGDYIIKTSEVNYLPAFSSSFTLQADESIRLPVLSLEKKSTTLTGVTVSARKPFILKLTDRIVVNVDNSIISAGSSALDVLERSPGVTIDPNDNIVMRGKSGVIIMIDGKPTPMSGADLVTFLRGLPSSAIERIDLITNPSARYDASGNAGIIDIRMKKDQRYGSNGTFTAGYGQGVYPKTNAGLSMNYRNKKMNLFGNYNYSYRMHLNHLFLDRNFFDDNGTFSGKDEKDNFTKIPINFNTVRVGGDFFPSKKTILGFVINSNYIRVDPKNNNRSTVIDGNKQPVYTFRTKTNNHNKNSNTVANINFKHLFDSAGKELTVDLDYGTFSSSSLSTTLTHYYKLDGSMQQPDYILNGNQAGSLHFTTAKADYSHPFKKGGKLEAGFKTSYVSSDNDARFSDLSSGTPQNDVNKTNRFFYDENNQAGYLNYGRDFKKISLQFGLRAEQTNVKTRQVKGDKRWDSSYVQLFPSAFFNYKLKEDRTLGISVSRRIDRPGYNQLNPFLFLIDVTTYSTGNPGLLPQFTWSYELSYTLKNLAFTLGYSHTTKNQNIVIARFKDVFPAIPSEDNVTVQIPVNLTSSDYYGLTVAAPVKIRAWWNIINNIIVYYNHFNGNLGGTALNNGRAVFQGSSNSSFSLKKGWSAELSASLNTGGQYGFMALRPQWGVGAGIQKKMLKDKATLRFNITDIFWTNLPEATITYDNYIEYWHAIRESRVANLTFTYRFGNSKVQGARRHTTGSEEERQRAGN